MSETRKMSLLEPELDNRDPNGINTHSVMTFYEVIGEPDDMHSMDCTWKFANKCFDASFSCCYKLLAAICALPLVFVWALKFATVGFLHVYGLTPLIKCCHMNLLSLQKLFGLCVHCFYDPCYESASLLFSNIRVTLSKPEIY